MIITTLTILLLPFLIFLKLGLLANRLGTKLSGVEKLVTVANFAIVQNYGNKEGELDKKSNLHFLHIPLEETFCVLKNGNERYGYFESIGNRIN